jgi:hypothetical protein
LMPWARLASAAGATIGFSISTSRASWTLLHIAPWFMR